MTWRGTIPVFIINFNRLASLRGMVDYFRDVPGTRTVIIDNRSTYPPLLRWYHRECPCQVVYLDANHGHHSPWTQGIVGPRDRHLSEWGSDWYIVTDPDLDLSGVPKDFISVMLGGFPLWDSVRASPALLAMLDRCNGVVLPDLVKVGLSLENADLPSALEERLGQARFWARPLGDYFLALVDTTLAVYPAIADPLKAMRADPALRTNRPYTARHIPWYIDVRNLSEEDAWYFASCGKSATWRPDLVMHS